MSDKSAEISKALGCGWKYGNMEKELDSTTIMLLFLSRHSHMPELYAELGQEVFLQLVRVFGGTKLVLPSEPELITVISQVHIYTQLRDSPPDKIHGKRAAIARSSGMTTAEVQRIYNMISKEVEKLLDSSTLIAEDRRKSGQQEQADSIALVHRTFFDD